MSFAASGLTLVMQTLGDGPALWNYTSNDAHGDVDGTDYFALMGKGTGSGASNQGMKVGDIVMVRDADTATGTLHYVSAVDSEGNVTVAAATLS